MKINLGKNAFLTFCFLFPSLAHSMLLPLCPRFKAKTELTLQHLQTAIPNGPVPTYVNDVLVLAGALLQQNSYTMKQVDSLYVDAVLIMIRYFYPHATSTTQEMLMTVTRKFSDDLRKYRVNFPLAYEFVIDFFHDGILLEKHFVDPINTFRDEDLYKFVLGNKGAEERFSAPNENVYFEPQPCLPKRY